MAGSFSTPIVILSDEEEPTNEISPVGEFTGRRATRSTVKFQNADETASEATEPETESEEEDCADKLDGEGIDEDGSLYLTGKPRFDVVICKSHVGSCPQMYIPRRINDVLPHATTRAFIRYQNKTWNTVYYGKESRPRLRCAGWVAFVKDSSLRVGDACVFEVMQNRRSMIEFRVQILRRDVPPELAAYLENKGGVQKLL